MKKIRKILMIGALTAVMILTLTASVCANEITTEILYQDITEIDAFLSEVDTKPYSYQFGDEWTYGIIINKQWTDDKDGRITSTKLIIRTMDKEIVVLSFGKLRSLLKDRWNSLQTGDFLVFYNPALPYSGLGTLLTSGLHIIMPNTETGFTEKIRDHSDL